MHRAARLSRQEAPDRQCRGENGRAQKPGEAGAECATNAAGGLAEKRAALEIAKKKAPPDAKEIERLTEEVKQLDVKINGPVTASLQQRIDEKEKEKAAAAGEYQKSKIEDELKELRSQLAYATEKGKDTGRGAAFRPQASMVSKITGQTYPLLLQMVATTPTTRAYAYDLTDVPARKQYHGEGHTAQAAAWNDPYWNLQSTTNTASA